MMSEIELSDEEDRMIWMYNSNGKYSVQSLYAVVNFRGITPVYVSSIWKLNIPPRVQFFLWLLSKNKLLTRDNLAKRREVSNATCLLCAENESICHLFFDCCIAKIVWGHIACFLDLSLGESFESVAKFWLTGKKGIVTNAVSAAVLWSLWKFRNELCFQGRIWMGMKELLLKIAKMLNGWLPLMNQKDEEAIKLVIIKLERQATSLPQLTWSNGESSSSGSAQLDALPSTSNDAI